MDKKQHKNFRFSGLRGEHDYFVVSASIFVLVGIFFSLRIWYGWDFKIESTTIPDVISWASILVAGYMAYKGFKYSKKG